MGSLKLLLTSSVTLRHERVSPAKAGYVYATALVLSWGLAFVPAGSRAQEGLGFGSGATVDEYIEQEIEEQVEEDVVEQVTEAVEEQIEEQIEELGFGFGEQQIEQKVEEQVEERIEDIIDETVNEDIASNIEDDIEQDVEDSIEEEIEEEIEDDIEQSVAEYVEDNIEDSIESDVEEAVASTIEDAVEEEVADSVEQVVEEELQSELEQVVEVNEDRLENQIDDVIDSIENDLEIDEDRIHKGKWLVMAEPEVFDELAKEGYLFDSITELPGLGMLLADVAAPSSFDITEARQGVIDVVGTGRAEVDLNHIYAAGKLSESDSEGIQPRSAIEVPTDTDLMALKIGMIDSQVDASHASLSSSSIQSRSFVSGGVDVPRFHGTAVASIIAANDEHYTGLAPHADLYAAGVFEVDPQQGEIASTLSLIRALDWLLSSDVEVVNISLAGPANRLLESANGGAHVPRGIRFSYRGNGSRCRRTGLQAGQSR
jgi:hypothetical protein